MKMQGDLVKMADKYGIQTRVGKRFHEEIEDINLSRIKNGKSKDKISMRKISNLIVRHKNFNKIKEDIIGLDEEELNEE